MASAVPHPTPPRDVGAFSLQTRGSRPVAVPLTDIHEVDVHLDRETATLRVKSG